VNFDGAIRLFTGFVYVWQLWGAGRTFRLPKEERPAFRHYMLPLAFGVVIGFSIGRPVRAGFVIPGAIGLAGALALFEWARRSVRGRYFSFVYSHDTPEFLWRGGPYAHIRNPFYTSYMLTAASVVLMHPAPVPIVAFGLLVLASGAAARHEERKFLASPLREEYQEYAGRTGRFIPFIGRLGTET
jgi:protein-S-isoprenylcysteine O-methyltransferase Ste14